MLLHHDDIQDLLRVRSSLVWSPGFLTLAQGSEEETIQFLEESAVVERVEIDENGGESRFMHS